MHVLMGIDIGALFPSDSLVHDSYYIQTISLLSDPVKPATIHYVLPSISFQHKCQNGHLFELSFRNFETLISLVSSM